MNIFSLSFGKDSMATLLLAMEPYSHNTFMPDTSLAEITKRFEGGYVPKRKKTITNYKQISIFDKE